MSQGVKIEELLSICARQDKKKNLVCDMGFFWQWKTVDNCRLSMCLCNRSDRSSVIREAHWDWQWIETGGELPSGSVLLIYELTEHGVTIPCATVLRRILTQKPSLAAWGKRDQCRYTESLRLSRVPSQVFCWISPTTPHQEVQQLRLQKYLPLTELTYIDRWHHIPD